MRPLKLALLLLGLANFAAAQTDLSQYYRVKVWRLTGMWTYAKHFQTMEVHGDTIKTRTYNGDYQVEAQFRMVQAKSHSSRHYEWRLEKDFQPLINTHVRVDDTLLTKPKNGKEHWVKTEVKLNGTAQQRSPDGTARLEIDPRDGACRVVAGFISLPGEIKITSSEGAVQEAETPFSFSSGMDEVGGRASGMTFGGFSSNGIASVPRERPDLDPVAFTWRVSPWEQDPEGEATFDLADHDWRPKVDAATTVEIKWKGKAEEVKLTEVYFFCRL